MKTPDTMTYDELLKEIINNASKEHLEKWVIELRKFIEVQKQLSKSASMMSSLKNREGEYLFPSILQPMDSREGAVFYAFMQVWEGDSDEIDERQCFESS